MDVDAEEREVRAYLALQGASEDWRSDIVAVLRSDAPISRLFRDKLAQAIDGDLFGFRLELVAGNGEKKRRRDFYVGAKRRRAWQAAGEWMLAREAASDAAAIRDAATNYSPAMGEKALEKALTYTRRLKRWRASLQPGDYRMVMGDDALDELFHQADAAGRPVDRRASHALHTDSGDRP